MSDFRDLLAIIIFVIVAVIFIIIPPLNETPVRALLGFPLVLFAPGYVFVSALFPENDELDDIERLALSIGLSICIVVFVGLGLNYTPWGIRLEPILFSIAAFTLVFTMISAHRRIRCEKANLGQDETAASQA
ncbi:MAG: DUF1616 domain-containing protein [Methanotrichaceae archaeon]